jgi:threonine/homoserine/homoserine lactone efflux protein
VSDPFAGLEPAAFWRHFDALTRIPRNGVAIAAMLALGVAFAVLTLGWLTLYALAVARARHALGRPRVRRALDAVMGTAPVALGVRLASQK